MNSAGRIQKNQLRTTRDLAWRALGYAGLTVLFLLIVGVSTYFLFSHAAGLQIIMVVNMLVLAAIPLWLEFVDPTSEAVRNFSWTEKKNSFNPAVKGWFYLRSPILDTPPPRLTLAA